MLRLMALLVGSGVSAMALCSEAAEETGGTLVPFPPRPNDIANAVWVLVIFIVMLAILYPTAWKGVLAGLKARESRIRKDIADAEAARVKAEGTLAEYNQQLAQAEDRVRGMLAKAQADGESLAKTIRDKASGEAEGIKTKALADIEEAGKVAVAQVHDQAVELSTLIAEKIIRRNLNAEDQRELVRASLQQLEAAKRN